MFIVSYVNYQIVCAHLRYRVIKACGVDQHALLGLPRPVKVGALTAQRPAARRIEIQLETAAHVQVQDLPDAVCFLASHPYTAEKRAQWLLPQAGAAA